MSPERTSRVVEARVVAPRNTASGDFRDAELSAILMNSSGPANTNGNVLLRAVQKPGFAVWLVPRSYLCLPAALLA